MSLTPGSATSSMQYGVLTPCTNTVLMVTSDLAEAERALEWIDGGRIVARTITISAWQIEFDEHADIDLPQVS